MKYSLFSVVAGSRACDAHCQFCISRMTPPNGMTLKEPDVNWRNFRKAAAYAKGVGVPTVMITGKGEPTLFPDQISAYMRELEPFQFPFIELQTNGLKLYQEHERYADYLKEWYGRGMTLVAVSIVHYDEEKNREVYTSNKARYIDLPSLIDRLHDVGLSVRLSGILARDYIDDPPGLERLIGFAQENYVEQLTVRPVNMPAESESATVRTWTEAHLLLPEQLKSLENYCKDNGHLLQKLPHGATVYDIGGQNVCLANSLTIDPSSDEQRQLIFFPDGHLRYDWRYPGAILL